MSRTFAIADIHGCCRASRRMLCDVVRLKKENIPYLLGDYIGRGQNSKCIIETIMGLLADGYKVLPIR